MRPSRALDDRSGAARLPRLTLASWAAAAVLGLLSCGGPGALPPLGDHDVTILYTKGTRGYTEPCRCHSRTTGGLSRRARFVRELREAGEPVIVLETGDSFFRFWTLNPHEQSFYERKARLVRDLFDRMGMAALAVGEKDFAAGLDFCRELAEGARFPFLAANLVDRETRKPVFEEHRIVEAGGVRVGIVGLLAPRVATHGDAGGAEGNRLVQRSPRDPRQGTVAVADIAGTGIEILDPLEVAREQVRILRPQVHLLILLSHLGTKIETRIANEVEGFDVILGGHDLKRSETPEVEGKSLVLGTLNRAVEVGVLQFRIRQGSQAFTDDSERSRKAFLRDLASRAQERMRREGLERDLQPSGVEANADVEKAIEDARRVVQAQGDPGPAPETSTYAYFPVRMDYLIGWDPGFEEALDAYQGEVREDFERLAATTPPDPVVSREGKRDYVAGQGACQECHEEQYAFAQETGHVHALESLAASGRQYDLDCLGCHVVGYRAPGGFDQPARIGDRGGVQCENCHGVAGRHLEPLGFLDPRVLRVQAESIRCEICHDNENSPDFDREDYLPRVACPPADPSREPLVSQIASGLDAFLEGEPRDLPRNPITLWHAAVIASRAGFPGRSAACLEQAIRLAPDRFDLRYGRAEQLLAAGRGAEAVERLTWIAEHFPANWLPLVTLSRAHLEGLAGLPVDPEAALEAAQRAVDLAGREAGPPLAALALALHVTGRKREACERARQALFVDESLEAQLAPVLEDCPAEGEGADVGEGSADSAGAGGGI